MNAPLWGSREILRSSEIETLACLRGLRVPAQVMATDVANFPSRSPELQVKPFPPYSKYQRMLLHLGGCPPWQASRSARRAAKAFVPVGLMMPCPFTHGVPGYPLSARRFPEASTSLASIDQF